MLSWMKGGIYLLGDGELSRITEERIGSEDVLQRYLAEHPELLAGEQIDEAEPRSFLLLTREADVPDDEEATGRWSMDHLFVDQDAVPTFVEVKRRRDTRIRRTVVGQMLEYAANATMYWDPSIIRTRFEERARLADKDPDAELARLLGEDADADAFWEDLETNLKAGKIRMLFVADEVPGELKRIVAFLNRHLDKPEVLAVEIKQYAGEGQTALVPRVYGKTAESDGGTPRQRHDWDEESFLREAKENLDAETYGAVEEVYHLSRDLIHKYGGNPNWGSGKTGAFLPVINPLSSDVIEEISTESSLFSVTTEGGFHCKFWSGLKATARSTELVDDFKKRLFDIEGLEEAHEEHCGGTAGGIPPETWVPVKDQIVQAIEQFYAEAN